MNRTLTQREIDSLFRGADAAGVARAAEVVPYSFARPRRISKERLSALEAIYGDFASSLGSWLTLRMRSQIEIMIASVEQIPFSELLLSLGPPSASFVFRSGDWHGLVDLSVELAAVYVDRLLGGRGDLPATRRPLTAIEEKIARGLAERALEALRAAWEGELPITPAIESFEADPEMIEIAPREENVLVTILEVRCNGATGILTVCMPMEAVEPFLREKTVRNPRERRSPTGEGTPAPSSSLVPGLTHASLAVSARLPVLFVSAREITDLKEGQVIHTDHSIDAPVEILLNGRVRFVGSLGQRQRRLALKVLNSVDVPVSDRPERIKEGRVL
jgi:flagellar motor switch protein FliM